MFFNIDVHSDHSHNFSNDEGEGSKIKRPTVGIAFLGVTLPGVSGVG
jgi:hypothetical protein